MFLPTIIMAFLAIVLFLIGYAKGQGQHIEGAKIGFNLMVQVLPLLFFAFIVSGIIQVLVPREYLVKWIGSGSGLRGIIIGSIAGGLSPGGPYVNLPIVAILLNSGASIGTTVAFITGWSLYAVSRLPMEVGILGVKFTICRLLSTFLFPPLAGTIAQTLFGSLWGQE
jgi:uncharacterized membrane protein YraQ (UPF0718 family)